MNNNEAGDADIIKMLNSETGKISWEELQPHFARGVVVKVDPSLDLLHVALEFVKDNKDRVSTWLETGKMEKVTDKQAKIWSRENPVLWSVVAAPWVLVQTLKQ